MAKFRKKPVVIEAVQWTGQNWKEVYNFTIGGDGNSNTTGPHPEERISIHTLEGVMFADLGDWIIKGVKGEFYPCKPDIFEATYDAVEEE